MPFGTPNSGCVLAAYMARSGSGADLPAGSPRPIRLTGG